MREVNLVVLVNDLNHVGLFVVHPFLDFYLRVSAVRSANPGVFVLPFQVHNLAIKPAAAAKPHKKKGQHPEHAEEVLVAEECFH